VNSLIKASARHPWLALAVLALITALFGTQLAKLRVSISASGMLEKDTPAYAFFEQAQAVFGADSITVLLFSDPKLFTASKLEAVRDAIYAIDKLPFVAGTTSLFSTRNVKNEDGVISTQPYLREIPKSEEELAQVKADALNNPLLARNLISIDGTTLGVNVIVQRDPENPDFDQRVVQGIEAIIAPLRGELDTVFQIGSSGVRDALTTRILKDQKLLLPLSLAVLLVTLAASLRRLSAAILPLFTAGLSVVWTLGFMAWLGIPVGIMTSIVPALIIVIGSTEDIHLLSEYLLGIREGKPRRTAIDLMADNMGLTVLLTFVTTYLGFFSITLNDIELLYQFGLASSTGLFFNFAITVVLVPVMLRMAGSRTRAGRKAEAGLSFYQRLAVAILGLVRGNRWPSLILVVLITAIAVIGASRLGVNNNPMDFLEPESPLHAQADTAHRELSGIQTFSIVVDGGIDGTFLKVKYLTELEKIQQYLDGIGIFDRSLSFADFIAFVNRVMDGEPGDEPVLPEFDDIVREYMLFIKHEEVSQYVSPEYDRARILVRHNVGDSVVLNDAADALAAFVAENIDPALRVEVTGEAVLGARAVEVMARGQFISLLLVGTTVFFVVSLLFVNFRAGLVALVPNLIPVVVLFGVMGFFDIPMDVGTSMVAAIALGICVDDTMHAMSRYHHELKRHKDRDRALRTMIEAEAVPIFTTSVALAAGFGVLAASSFIPVMHFGLLSALVILVALLATFSVTPLLLGSAELLTVWDLLSYKMRKEDLKSSPLFRGMNAWQIKKVILTGEIRSFATGDQILREGEEGTEMFVVLDGVVEAQKTNEAGVVSTLRSIGVGEIFGEVAAFAGGRRTADIMATGNTQVLVMSWERINNLARLFPFIAFRLFRNISRILGEKLGRTREFSITPQRDVPSGSAGTVGQG
jgi:predicted RND superfamily exporter protein